MFSVLFPGQGSQSIGMAKVFYDNFDYVKSLYQEADDLLKNQISKLILEGPKDKLDLTENTQPAIFLVSYSIFQVIKKETSFDINSAKYFAGHSLGEYSALSCAEVLTFSQTIKLLKKRGQAMQSAVPKGQGGMLAVLGTEIDKIKLSLIKVFDEDPDEVNKVIKEAIKNKNHSKSLHHYTSFINKNYQDKKKLLLIEALWEIVLSDGEIHDYESNLLRRLAGLLYISDINSGNARKRALDKIQK